MTDQIAIALTFILFLLLFTLVGIYSAREKQATITDYLLASRKVNPWLTALSAMATGQSGLLFTVIHEVESSEAIAVFISEMKTRQRFSPQSG